MIKHAEGKCQDWFSANETIPITSHPLSNTSSQVICLKNICLVDESWNLTSRFSGCGWVWKDISGQIQLMGTWKIRRHESALHSELETLTWAMESICYVIQLARILQQTAWTWSTCLKNSMHDQNSQHSWKESSTAFLSIQDILHSSRTKCYFKFSKLELQKFSIENFILLIVLFWFGCTYHTALSLSNRMVVWCQKKERIKDSKRFENEKKNFTELIHL